MLFPRSAVHQLWWLAVAGAGVAARHVQLRLRPAPLARFGADESTARLLREQENHGYNAHSLVSIAPGTHFWSCPEVDGAVPYNKFGKVWLVPGEPLASEEDAPRLARRFIAAARAEGCMAAFMPVTERFALQAQSLGLGAAKIAAAPYFDLGTWGPRGDRGKKARAGVNQARRAGVRVTPVYHTDQKLKAETTLLCRNWLQSRRAVKLSWLFTLDPFAHAGRKKFFTARDRNQNLVGFLAASPMPAREGWYLEDVLRSPDAPSGTADLLVVEALNFLKNDGAKVATLGTSPIARDGQVAPEVGNNELISQVLRIATGCFSLFYNFEGLRRFKAKFAPSWWESEYVLFPQEMMAGAHIARAVVQAIAPQGATRLVAQQIVKIIKPQRADGVTPDNDAGADSQTSPVSIPPRVRPHLAAVNAAINAGEAAVQESSRRRGLKLVRLPQTASSDSANSMQNP